jgi:hypothetical protein
MTDLAEPILDTVVAAPRAAWRRAVAPALAVAFLSAVAWVSHFSNWRQLGFFSDDHSFATLVMAWTPTDAARQAEVLAFAFPEPQGRPLGFLLGLELPYLGYRAAGVFGMYLVGWLILSANGALLYALLARRLPRPMPLAGALMFLLFPADTTRPFLCHAHILQPSITFALLAAHLFLSRKAWVRAIGYPVAALCLLTYETAFLPLLAVPLLDWDGVWMRRGAEGNPPRSGGLMERLARGPLPLRRLVRHGLILGAIMLAVAVARTLGGEDRAAEANGGKLTILWEMAAGSVLGPAMVIRSCWHWPRLQIIAAVHDPRLAGQILAASAGFAVVIGLATRRAARPSVAAIRQASLFGGAALGVSYVLCFRHFPPVFEQGQATSVHTAAALGCSALAAAVAGLVLRRSRVWFVALAALYFGLLTTSAIDEQHRFTVIWHERQSYWRQVLALCPDMTDQTVILSDGTMPQPTWVMPVNLWSDAMVPAQVYKFPAAFRIPPILSPYLQKPGEDWRSNVQWDGAARLIWRVTPCNCTPGQELMPGNTILLRLVEPGRFVRLEGTVDVDGRPQRFRPIPPPGTRAPYPHLPFYDVLVGPTGGAATGEPG